MKNKKHWYIFLLFISLLFSACSISSSKMENKEDVVSSYLDALTNKDKEKILSLCAPDHIGVEDIVTQKVEQFGGYAFLNIAVEYAEEISPAYAKAEVKGTYQKDGKEFTFQDEIFLQKVDEYWYIVLGKYKDAINIPGSKP